MTSFEYVGNDLRKKSKQFFMIVTTVFLTVSFMTFLSLIGQLSPLQMLLQTESASGDFDMVIMGNTDKLEPVYATKNFYVDDQEFFNAKSLDQSETRLKMDHRTILSKIPFVNFTLIEETLDEYYGEMERPFEVFPRWIAQSKIFNDEGTRQSNAYVVAVDSVLERKIIVGHNFPNMVLEQGQMITTTDVLKLLGNNIGDLIEINVSI